jgi:hypothetical protein
MIMGMNIILTEQQIENLQAKVGGLPINEGKVNLACRYIDFESLDEELGEKKIKKIGYETVIRRIDDFTIGVKYHATDIIRVDPTNIVTLSNGGWDTPTTKDRLNQFLNCLSVSIYQKKHVWYIVGDNGTFEFVNGIEVHPGGYIVTPKGKSRTSSSSDLNIDPSLKRLYGIRYKENN